MPVEFLNWMQNLNDAQVNAFEINIGIEFCKSISKKRKMNNKFTIFLTTRSFCLGVIVLTLLIIIDGPFL